MWFVQHQRVGFMDQDNVFKQSLNEFYEMIFLYWNSNQLEKKSIALAKTDKKMQNFQQFKLIILADLYQGGL